MKRLIITWALAVALFGLVRPAEAVKPAGKKPFVNVTTTPDELNLGTVPFFGMLDKPAAFTVKVESNCAYGSIMMAATSLKHSSGASIAAKRIFVQTWATEGYISMDRPVVISKPQEGSNDIVVDIKVQTDMKDFAGKYSGSFTFTIIPPV
ncbi:MAG: hypothetical protein ABIF19_11100 [Planctomycetota bacterium]